MRAATDLPPPARPAPAARLQVAVRSELDVAHVIGAVTQFCTGQGLPVVLAAHVATAASELANNLWMHTDRGGVISLSLLDSAGGPGVELVAEDDGPGIADIAQAITEGYSSAGSMGCGLPGVQRLMDELNVQSQPGIGTRVTTRKWLCRHP